MNGTLLVAGILRNAEAFLPQWRQKLENLSQYFAAESWVEQNRDVVGISVSSKVSRCRNCVIPLFDIHPQKVFGGQGGCVFEDVDVMNMCFSKNPQQQSRRRHSRRLI